MVLHKVAALVMKCMTAATYSELAEATLDINGKQLIANDAVKKFVAWRKANKSGAPGEEPRRPQWSCGTFMINKEINDQRALPCSFVW